MLREFQKAPKTFCRAAATRMAQPAPSLPPNGLPVRGEGVLPGPRALSCSTRERPTATLPGPHCTVYSVSTEPWKKTDVFLPPSNQQCRALPAHGLPVLRSGAALATVAYPSPSAAFAAAQSSGFPGRHAFLARRHPPTASGGARGWQTGPAASGTLL